MKVKVNGVWKSNAQLSINVSATWKLVYRAYVKVNGEWRFFYGNPEITVTDFSGNNSNDNRILTFKTTPGTVLQSDWLSGGDGIDTTKLSETQYKFTGYGASGVKSGVMRFTAIREGKATILDVNIVITKA